MPFTTAVESRWEKSSADFFRLFFFLEIPYANSFLSFGQPGNLKVAEGFTWNSFRSRARNSMQLSLRASFQTHRENKCLQFEKNFLVQIKPNKKKGKSKLCKHSLVEMMIYFDDYTRENGCYKYQTR